MNTHTLMKPPVLTLEQIDKQLALFSRYLNLSSDQVCVTREHCLIKIDSLLDQRLALTSESQS